MRNEYLHLLSQKENNHDIENSLIKNSEISQTQIKIIFLLKSILIYLFISILFNSLNFNKLLFNINLNQKVPYYESDKNTKIALCTMGKNENLYANEFVAYYIQLGFDHIFIYDDNEENTEKIKEAIDTKYLPNVTIYDNIKKTIKNQSDAFNDCYKNNMKKYDWILMADMDEFLFVVNDTVKHYLSSDFLDKCDFIKINWVMSTDNGLIKYDSRTLLERFKPPYIKDLFIKTFVRGNIPDMKYWVHSPLISPTRNISCNNIGQIQHNKKLKFEQVDPVNVEKAFLIHFRFKSTEEFVKKNKRGYSNWFGDEINWMLNGNINTYFEQNEITWEKINYIEKELNIFLIKFRILLFFKMIFFAY